MPAIAKILIVFAGMLGTTRVRVPLGVSLVLGGISLALWSGMPPMDTFAALGQSLLEPELWLLLAVTALIIELGRFSTSGRNAETIVAATRRWGGRHGRSASLMALPAMIGLIPMPGGALFSAPFVAQVGDPVAGEGDWKTAVNYWFRHVWEYWWPLYPGVIVTMSIFDIPTWRFFAVQVPFTAVAVGAGYCLLIRRYVGRLTDDAAPADGNHRGAALVFGPLVIVVLCAMVLPGLLSTWFPAMAPQMRKLTGVLVGLVIGLAAALAFGRHAAGDEGGGFRLFAGLLKRKSLNVIFTLIGVLVFKHMLDRAGLVPTASTELMTSGIPVSVAVAVLPFLAGLVTGLALGFAGVSFPLVVGLMAVEGLGLRPLSTLVLAYGFGYMGMMLSPIHLCFLVSKDYFGTSHFPVYRRLLPCAATVLAYTILAHVMLRGLHL